MSKILFLAGPSGSGKSFFASHYLSKRGWLHLEIDRFPENGIDVENVRSEWDDFLNRLRPDPLHRVLLGCAGSPTNVVLSFPGNLVFSPDHLRAPKTTPPNGVL